MSTDAKTNGTSPSIVEKSQFLSHLSTYPLLTTPLHAITAHPYAQSPLTLTHRTITTLTPYAAPLVSTISPYATPYLTRLDTLADSALNAFDARVPAAKKPVSELYDETKEFYAHTRERALWPYTLSVEGAEHVRRTWEGEVKRENGKGVFGLGRAVFGTGVVVGGEVVEWARGEGKRAGVRLTNGEGNGVNGVEEKH